MRANSEDRRAHLDGVLIKELIRGHDRNPEFARLAQDRVETAPVRHEVLNFVAVESKELAFLTGEQRILYGREEQTSERGCLFAEFPFVEVDDEPLPPIDRVENRECRAFLAHNV